MLSLEIKKTPSHFTSLLAGATVASAVAFGMATHRNHIAHPLNLANAPMRDPKPVGHLMTGFWFSTLFSYYFIDAKKKRKCQSVE